MIDRCIGPAASTLDELLIPDMAGDHDESRYWIVNHFLNVALRNGFNPPLNAYAHTYMRRAHSAYVEHAAARQASLAFVESKGQAVAKYSLAITHWEYFLAQSWQAYPVLRGLLTELSGERVSIYEKDDGSTEQRLNSLHNAMKHAESRIEAGQILEGAISPVWLTKQGLQSTDTLITYQETADILRDLATWADVLVDPSRRPRSCGICRSTTSRQTERCDYPSTGTRYMARRVEVKPRSRPCATCRLG